MSSYKVIQLLKVLTATEWNELLTFLQSPYFTRETDSWQLCLTLRTYLGSEGATLPEAEEVFQRVWPGRPFDRKNFIYALSRLNKLAERFLVQREQDKQPEKQSLAAMRLFSERQLDKHLLATKRSMSKSLISVPDSGADFYLLRSDHAALMDQHYIRQKIRKQDDSIQQATNDLDRFYYLRRLQYACSMLDRQNILKSDYRIGLSDAWISHLADSSICEEPMIYLYLTIFRALREEDQTDHFQKLKLCLLQLINERGTATLMEPLLFAINYCARKIRAGQENYAKEALELYHKGITSGILLRDEQISPWTYTNIIKLSLRLKQYAEAHDIIEKYTALLPEDFRENAHNYNYAELLYYTNQKEKAQEYLNQVAYSDLSYYLGARVLLAKIYYETDAEEALLSLLASFTIFLQRNKQISRNLKLTYLNFCQLFSRILRTSTIAMEKVIAVIEEKQPLTDRAWLLEVATTEASLNPSSG